MGDRLIWGELIAVGSEVGVPARHLQQAILEECPTLGGATSPGVLERFAGPGRVSAQRVISLNPDDAERCLIDWMERNELLCIQRQQAGRITWEPLGGFQAAMRRS